MPAQVASARVFHYRGALREYSEARGMEPDRYWRAMLLVVTAADSLWEKARPYIDFAAGSAYLDQLRQEAYLSGGEMLLLDDEAEKERARGGGESLAKVKRDLGL
ncbi:MAG TPA: hypothetical protein PKH75_12920 [Bacillota bacterium]|nr:hypothetical protein [Bacillota bacterium]